MTNVTNSSSNSLSTGSSLFKSSLNKYNISIGFAGLIFIGTFIASFIQMSTFVGSKDDWNVLKTHITQVIVLVMIGTIAFIVASLMFFIQDPQKSIYFTIIVSGLSMGLAFMALAISAISR